MTDRSKIPLVLLPGSLCDETLWAPQAAALSDVAQAQIVPCGALDSVIAMAQEVLARVEAPRFALAGFSLGGFVALEVMRRAGARVTHLALLDTAAQADRPENERVRKRNIAAFRAGESDRVVNAFVDLLKGPSTAPEVMDAVRTTMLRLGPEAYVPQQLAMMLRPDARAVLKKTQCPVLILCGGADRATPPALHREMAALVPHALYVELPGVGHVTTLEAPDDVSRAMRIWLGS